MIHKQIKIQEGNKQDQSQGQDSSPDSALYQWKTNTSNLCNIR